MNTKVIFRDSKKKLCPGSTLVLLVDSPKKCQEISRVFFSVKTRYVVLEYCNNPEFCNKTQRICLKLLQGSKLNKIHMTILMKEFQRSGKHFEHPCGGGGGNFNERRFGMFWWPAPKRWTLKVTVLHGLASLQWLYGHLDSTCWRMLGRAWNIKKRQGGNKANAWGESWRVFCFSTFWKKQVLKMIKQLRNSEKALMNGHTMYYSWYISISWDLRCSYNLFSYF